MMIDKPEAFLKAQNDNIRRIVREELTAQDIPSRTEVREIVREELTAQDIPSRTEVREIVREELAPLLQAIEALQRQIAAIRNDLPTRDGL